MGLLEFIMSEKEEIEIAVIPKGSKVQIMGCRVTLVEDTKVEGDQASLDYILKDQEDYDNGIGVVGEGGLGSKLATGAMSAMHVSANICDQTNINCREKYSKDSANEQLDVSMQKAIQDAAKVLNIANNARFINIVEWRTNMIDRLLSHISIKTIDEAISECQKLENHIFDKKDPGAPKDWRL